MRKSVDGANGASCDICGRILFPNDCIKLKFYKKDPEDQTGLYLTINTRDVCQSCYDNLMKQFPSDEVRVRKEG